MAVGADRSYRLEELAQGDVILAATGVTDGTLLGGRQAPQEIAPPPKA